MTRIDAFPAVSAAPPPLADAVRELVADARRLFDEGDAAYERLDGALHRFEEPLRIALAGMVKAGKSTLINGIVGDEIAPTDTGECTRVVTWYKYGSSPRITLLTVDGERRGLPVRRADGRLVLDLAGTPADRVERLIVHWPAESLRALTLIDTPGIASLSDEVSARSTRVLTPERGPSEADAVVYLMRHLHAADLGFLDAYRETGEGPASTVNTVAVLSRADEVGAGRIDAMVSAQEIAARYRREGGLGSLVLDVLPVAGLLAQSARTLRQSEFEALREFSELDRETRELLLLSADRFVRPNGHVSTTPDQRIALLDRFGLFGIRVAASLLKGPGGESATALADALRLQSGLDALLETMTRQFRGRAELLKARIALGTVAEVLREAGPGVARDRVARTLERIDAGAHGLRELQLISEIRTGGTRLGAGDEDEQEARRLIGLDGDTPRERLGLPPTASDAEARLRARALANKWRAWQSDPRLDRAGRRACGVVARSAEAQLARLAAPAR